MLNAARCPGAGACSRRAHARCVRARSLRKEIKRVYLPQPGRSPSCIKSLYYNEANDVYIAVFDGTPEQDAPGNAGCVKVYHAGLGELLSFPAHSDAVLCSTFSTALQVLVTHGRDLRTKLWSFQVDAHTNALQVFAQATLQHADTPLHHVCVEEERGLLVGASTDEVALWQLPQMELLVTVSRLTTGGGNITSLACHGAGIMVLGFSTGRLAVWSISDGVVRKSAEVAAHAGAVAAVTVADDGFSCFTSGADSVVSERALPTGQLVGSYTVNAKGFRKFGRSMPVAHPRALRLVDLTLHTVNKRLLLVCAGNAITMLEVTAPQRPFAELPGGVVDLRVAQPQGGAVYRSAANGAVREPRYVLGLLATNEVVMLDGTTGRTHCVVRPSERRDVGTAGLAAERRRADRRAPPG